VREMRMDGDTRLGRGKGRGRRINEMGEKR